MTHVDLAAIESLLDRARVVAPMAFLHYYGEEMLPGPDSIILRHDVDHAPGALENALAMAQWERRHGWTSTYYFLHTAGYWQPDNAWIFAQIGSLGHEVGFHNNAVGDWLATHRRAPRDILRDECHRLRVWSKQPVTGVASHGDQALSALGHRNWQIFEESPAQSGVKPLLDLGLHSFPLGAFGLDYQAEFLPRPRLLGDSGGSWDTYARGDNVLRLQDALKGFPFKEGHLTIAMHPDHWPAELFA